MTYNLSGRLTHIIVGLLLLLSSPLYANATFTNDNLAAGKLVGQWVAATLGDQKQNARIAFLNPDNPGNSNASLHNQGFMEGFGIDMQAKDELEMTADKHIVALITTNTTQKDGHEAMKKLLTNYPDTSVVYATDGNIAAGASKAIEDAGKTEDILIVTTDESCLSVQMVETGKISATSLLSPALIGNLGSEKKETQSDINITDINTGATLVTNKPVESIPSIDATHASTKCME